MFQIEGDCSWPMELCAVKVKCHLAVRSTHTPVTTLYLLVPWLTRCCHLALTIFVLRLVGFLALLYVLCSLLGNLKLSGLTIQPYACKHTHTHTHTLHSASCSDYQITFPPQLELCGYAFWPAIRTNYQQELFR